MEQRTILFYDGVCGLCDRTVQFLLRHKRFEDHGSDSKRLYFSPLQGQTAATLLSERDRLDLDSVVLFKDGVFFRKAQAIAAASGFVRFPWNLLLAVVQVIPLRVANIGYDLVAKYRYLVFGRFDSCKLPRPEQRKHFLP